MEKEVHKPLDPIALQKSLQACEKALALERFRRQKAERSLQEAEFRALSWQINPHFLFNVLNTISKLAWLEGAQRTETLVHQFSDMMRYLLRKNDTGVITLQHELEYLQCYLAIQQVRMQGRFDCLIDIPEKYRNVICPCLILQPLAENFFNYVVEPRETSSHLNIRATDNGLDLTITVSDNGDGIPRDVITQIFSPREEMRRGRIGISNIQNRLQLLFGRQYGLKIISPHRPQMGTTIRLRLPLQQPETTE